MTTAREFSDGFDVMLNSFALKAEPGEQASIRDIVLDEYEKSFFLTKAQEELVIAYYNGRNYTGDSFESTEEMRAYLANLVDDTTIQDSTSTPSISSKSKVFTLPPQVWFIIYEDISISGGDCGGHTSQEVVPITHDEYHRIKKNPFRGPNSRRALRLDLADRKVEIVSNYDIGNYHIRFIKRPCPIILADLSLSDENLKINGESRPQDPVCELHESLHQKILEGAVRLAIASRIGRTKD